MNIFFLSLIPEEIAELSCDQHVIKIQLEIAQMLYTAWYYAGQEQYVREYAPYTKSGSQRGYKPAHKMNLKSSKYKNSTHGIHVHEAGDLTHNCMGACSHFNPYNKKHGGPKSSERHVGDIGKP